MSRLTKEELFEKVISKKEKVDLSCLDFSNLNLTGANFTGAILDGAVFKNTVLVGANFSKVKGADILFKESDLTNVSFKDSNLDGSDFIRTKILGADFSNTILCFSTFKEVDSIEGCSFENADFLGAEIVDSISFSDEEFQKQLKNTPTFMINF